MRPSSSCTGMWTGGSLAEVPSTLRMPSSSLSRLAASSKRAAAASHGFFSFSKDMDSGNVDVATISLRFHYAIVGQASWPVHVRSFSDQRDFRASRYNFGLTTKTAFLSPGQGSQAAGMGKALADAYPAARRVFEEADEALGLAISRLCFEGPEDQLKLTENTQPALLTVSIAAFEVLRAEGMAPDYVAGHSLGEYSALVAAGSLRFADAVRLVRRRGQYMQAAVPPGVGAMAAILKLPEGKLEAVLAEAAQGEVVSAANLNSPDQVVIAGNSGAVNRAAELAKAAGARRAVLLPVSAPFHCALMAPAQERLRAALDATEFRDLACPLVNNWQAHEIRSGAEAREGVYQQVPNPVRWLETIRYLAAQGVARCVEVGAGGVLTGLLRNIDPALDGVKFGEPADLEKVRSVQ